MITYPINLPLKPAPKGIKITKRSAIASSTSPSSFVSQSYVWPGQAWQFDMSWPPGYRATMEPLVSALASLNGSEGSVLLGDSANPFPQGVGAGDGSFIVSDTLLNGGFETAGAGGLDVFANWLEDVAGGFGAFNWEASTIYAGAKSAGFHNTIGTGGTLRLPGVMTIGRSYIISAWTGRASSIGDGVNNLVPSSLGSSFKGPFTFVAAGTDLVCQFSPSNGQSAFIDSVILQNTQALVNGAGQTGYDLVTDGWAPSATVMKTGDWVQLGSGNTSRLYKVMIDSISDGSGNATLTLWPKLRGSPADNAPLTVNKPKGRFMLASGDNWNIDEAKCYGVEASFLEDLRP